MPRCDLCSGEGFIDVGALLQPCPQCLGTGSTGTEESHGFEEDDDL